MSRFRTEDTVASVVASSPPTSRVFEKHGIDYCCGGKISLSAACAQRGVDASTLVDELEQASAGSGSEADLSKTGLRDLIDLILSKHHAYVKREIPRLSTLMEKVARVHGENHPESLPPMAKLWRIAAAAFEQHMAREEEVLFPWIFALDEGRVSAAQARGIEMPISVMEAEHDEHGAAFARLRELAGNYTLPADACGSWRALWSGLEEFEQDLHRHVHLENHLLFPGARARAGLQPV